MAKDSLRSIQKRIDRDLDELIDDYARKNKMNKREASRDLAKLIKQQKFNKKMVKEIKI